MTQLLHDLGGGPYDRWLQLARIEYLSRSKAAAASLAETTPDYRRRQVSESARRLR